MFRDRQAAAEILAQHLDKYSVDEPVVLAIPRGGVPVGKVIADKLDADLDVVMSHKFGAPMNPELTVGAVSEFGDVHLTDIAELLQVSADYISRRAADEMSRLQERRIQYATIRAPVSIEGKTVILVDDGVFTGATALSVEKSLRMNNPKRIILAAPLAPSEVIERLRLAFDGAVIIDTPGDFHSIASFYENYLPVTDKEIFRSLQTALIGRLRKHRRPDSWTVSFGKEGRLS